MTAAPPFPTVTVIYGDPARSDTTKPDATFTPEDLQAIDRMKAALADLDAYHFRYLDDHTRLLAEWQQRPPDFALNFCDTGFMNDPARELHVPAFLELIGVPYSGAGPVCLGLCYDKAAVRAIAQSHDVPVPAELYVDQETPPDALPDRYPALIKPSTGDGSVGITKDSVVHSVDDAHAYLERLRRELPGRDALVQEFLTGPEYAIGLVGNPDAGYTVLPPLEVDYSHLNPDLPPILAFESKAVSSSAYWQQIAYREARLSDARRAELVGYAERLFARLGCRDYARFDFRTGTNGQPRLLEVNPNPAWCWDGKLNLMAGFAGYSYTDFLRMILEAAQQRIAAERAAAE